jgi:AraC-like DNA-binding protein
MTESSVSLIDRLDPTDGLAAADATPDVLGELLETLRLDTLVYGQFVLTAPWGVQFPDDDPVYLIAVDTGEARLEVSGVKKPLVLSPGDLAFLPRGGPHRMRNAAGSPLHALTTADCPRVRSFGPLRLGGGGARTTLVLAAFRFRAAHRALSIRRLSRSIHLASGHRRVPPRLASTLKLFISECTSSEPGASVVVNRLADVLLVEAIRAYIAGIDCPQHGLRGLGDPEIARALGLIHEHPEEHWTVERLASAVALSRSALAARFSALVGAPPADYLARWRMTRAAALLRDSDVPMSEIAARSGYRSEASFNRAFKRLEGVTPGRYRRGGQRARSTA